MAADLQVWRVAPLLRHVCERQNATAFGAHIQPNGSRDALCTEMGTLPEVGQRSVCLYTCRALGLSQGMPLGALANDRLPYVQQAASGMSRYSTCTGCPGVRGCGRLRRGVA